MRKIDNEHEEMETKMKEQPQWGKRNRKNSETSARSHVYECNKKPIPILSREM